ncbi:MAG: RloB family protein [Scardovia wiggsiae]
MLRKPQRPLSRRVNHREQKKLYIIVGEGAVTEKEYFRLFQSQKEKKYRLSYVSPRDNHGGNPRELMKEMEKQQRNHPNSKEAPTEYWIILDKEQSNVNRSLEPLYAWVRKSEANNLGITNTQFENWLLLHFQQKMASTNPVHDLSKYIKGYSRWNKSLNKCIHKEQILIALENARSYNVGISPRPANDKAIPNNSTSLPTLVQKLMDESEWE